MISCPSSQTSQPRPQARDGGLLPVVLHKADVVLARVDADGFQRIEIDLLRVARVRLEDDLELVMLLEAVGVLAVTAIIGAHGGLDIGHVPRLGPQHAQEGSGVHGPGADLGVVGLPEQGAALGPELLEGENDGWKEAFWIFDFN